MAGVANIFTPHIMTDDQFNDRRQVLSEKLKNYRSEKLKRKLPVESQMFSLGLEEFKLKKQMLEKI